MAFAQQDVRDEVNSQLKDNNTFLRPADIDVSIKIALRHLNHDNPLRRVVDIDGDATQSYGIEASPVGFVRGFSDLKKVETPAGQIPPVFKLKGDDWIVYEDPDKTGATIRLLFLTITPTATEDIRITLTVPSTIPDLNDTGFNALVYKSISLGLSALANRFSQTTDSTIAADTVDRLGLSNNAIFLSQDFDKKYKLMAGLTEQTKAAQAIGEADIPLFHGEGGFWHPRRLH